MGGSGLYHPPVKNWTGIATWEMHTNRGTPSTEPGVDWYCPRFTDLHAAASGVVVGVFYGIGPATGRYITIDLDDGRRVRYLHLEEIYVTVGQRVAWGEVIGKTGATGYGEADWSWNVAETGGAHVHQTVFPRHAYVFGRYATLDPWPLTDTSSASVAGAIQSEEDDDMKAVSQAGLPDSGIIIQAGVPPYALPRQVFEALMVSYGLTEHVLPDWQYGTVVREQWTAANIGAGLAKDGPAKVDVAPIVAAVYSAVDGAVVEGLDTEKILQRLSVLPAEVVDQLKARL